LKMDSVVENSPPSEPPESSKKSKKRKAGQRNTKADETKKAKRPEGRNETGETAATGVAKAGRKKAEKGRKSPTWFVGIPVTCPEIHQGIKHSQQRIVDDTPELFQSTVAISKSHITLFVLNLDDGDVADGKLEQTAEAIRVAVDEWRSKWRAPYLTYSQVGHFGHRGGPNVLHPPQDLANKLM